MYLNGLSDSSLKTKLVLGVSVLFLLYYISYHAHQPTHGQKYGSPSWEKWTFINTRSFARRWLDVQLLEPFEKEVIREYCAATDWRTNVIFNIQEAIGGVQNIRAMFLDFVFFAIDVGASIVLPEIGLRSDTNLYDVWHGPLANFSHMFDDQHFLATMHEVCPQMRILQPGEQTVPAMRVIEELYHWRSRREDHDPGNTRPALRASVDDWVRNHNMAGPNTNVMIKVDRTMWEADTRSMPPSLRRSFPLMLRTNPAIRRFAGLAMANMASQYNVPLRPSDNLHQNAFFGAHLRTEADTFAAGWFDPTHPVTEWGVDFEGQTDAFLALAAQHNLTTMYVATGNSSEFDRFVVKAANVAPKMKLLHKFDLLSEEEGAELRKLKFDQQGFVDLEILLRCSMFGGFAKSSFAAAIATARHEWLEIHGKPLGRAWYMRELEEKHIAFDDPVSQLVGRNEAIEKRCPRGCWP